MNKNFRVRRSLTTRSKIHKVVQKKGEYKFNIHLKTIMGKEKKSVHKIKKKKKISVHNKEKRKNVCG